MWRSCESQIDETVQRQLRRTGVSGLGRTSLLGGLAAALSLSAGTVLAQTAPPAAPAPAANASDQLSEVVVTAQFKQENVQETPLAITAISASQLADRGQTSIQDIMQDAPGVYLTPTTTAFGPSLNAYIRGIGQSDQDPALEPGIGIYVDDVYYGTITGADLDLTDLDRVEVLRGPQGTLEGMNSEGGAIKLFSKLPDATPSTTFDALYGSRNHVELRASTDFAISDNLFVRIAGVGNHQDGYEQILDFGCANPTIQATDINGVYGTYSVPIGVRNQASSCQTGEEGGVGYTGGRVSVRWLATDSVENLLIGDISNTNQENPAETLIQAQPPLAGNSIGLPVTNITNPANPIATSLPYNSALVPAMIPKSPYQTYTTLCLPALPAMNEAAACGENNQILDGWGVSDTLTWKINDALQLKNIIADRGYTSKWYEDNDASPWPLGLGSESLDHHQFSEELRLSGSAAKLLDWTAGVFYFSERTVYASQQDLWYAEGPGVLDFIQDDPITAHDKAAYLHTVWHLTSKLDVTLGTRYTSQDKTYNYVRLNPDGTPATELFGTLNGASARYQDGRGDYRGDIAYHLTDQLMTYAQVSTGFKGGGVDPRPFYVQQAVPFAPESLTTYEVGIKSTWFDNRLRVNLDGYSSQYKNIQLTLPDCAGVAGIPASAGIPCALPFNAGNGRQYGVELETLLKLGGFQIDFSGAYLNFYYTDLFYPAAVTGVAYGMDTPLTPKLSGDLGMQYSMAVPKGSITLRVDANGRSSVYAGAVNYPLADLATPDGTNYLASYILYNAHLTWESPNNDWSIALQALNFTNKFYWMNIFDLASASGGSVTGNPNPPREFDLEIKHKL
jgi:iron complex outermembrane recepter protein